MYIMNVPPIVIIINIENDGLPFSLTGRDLQPASVQFTGKIGRVRQNELLTSVRHAQPPFNDGRTPEHGYTISSPCEPNGSGELITSILVVDQLANLYSVILR